MSLTVLDGSTFCISDPRGDLDGGSTGLYADDTRFLSRFVLTLDGERPQARASRSGEGHFATTFELEAGELLVVRDRAVGDGMRERICVENRSTGAVRAELALELGTDFADVFAGKQSDHGLERPLPDPARASYRRSSRRFLFRGRNGFAGRTLVLLSRAGEVAGSAVRFPVELEPGERWELRVDVAVTADGERLERRAAERKVEDGEARVRDSFHTWNGGVPRLETAWDELSGAYARSLHDLAALRMRDPTGSDGYLIAAGMPWFMTVFGRDTLITSLQTLMLGPELAHTALRALAALQAVEDDGSIDAEPGKILHELRRGMGARTWLPRYYGSVDSTPLYLVLVSELWRWTGDDELALELRAPALRALGWLEEYADLDGDGFVEFRRRSPTGIENQGWKDSGDSQLFADGSEARAPLAGCEVQGYAYDARVRLAELAREAWGDPALAARLEREAAALRARFDEAFWCERRGGYYALALDGSKRRVDSLTSNIGHLLWSGIVPPERAGALAGRLVGDDLFSGFGIRTMAASDGGYNPVGYHTGTVWPHDTALGAAGLARYGFREEAWRIARGLLEAAVPFGHQLPEAFAGFPRADHAVPLEYPTAAKPQAWAAGSPIFLLQTLLGLQPDRRARTLRSVADAVPPELEGLGLYGVPAFGRRFDVAVEAGLVSVQSTP